jgi:hypothetical protein
VREDAETRLPADRRPELRERFGQLNEARYDDLARELLAAEEPSDPRYDDLLIGFMASSHSDFTLLWDALFNRNERQYGASDYAIFLDVLLKELSAGYHRQEVLVTGHIPCNGGFTVVAERQIRLASGAHAHPHEAGRYLLFDVAEPVRGAQELVHRLKSVYA